MTTAKNKPHLHDINKDAERLTLQVLRKDLMAYLDLHGVFEPGDTPQTHALATISDELKERVTSIVQLASVVEATSPLEAAEKLQIYATLTENAELEIPADMLRNLLLQTITDLKKDSLNY